LGGKLRVGLPATLAAAALVVAALGATPLGEAATDVVRMALFAKNAGKVNGIKAARRPRAGRLVPLGPGGRFPAAVMPRGAIGPAGPRGPVGPAGAQGEKGDPGEAATRLWAVVAADGTLVRGRGAVAASRLAVGTYEISFEQPVSACALLATLAAPEGAAGGATGQVGAAVGEPQTLVRTETETSSGTNADRGFHVTALC
jgi:hypothetical protein